MVRASLGAKEILHRAASDSKAGALERGLTQVTDKVTGTTAAPDRGAKVDFPGTKVKATKSGVDDLRARTPSGGSLKGRAPKGLESPRERARSRDRTIDGEGDPEGHEELNSLCAFFGAVMR